VIKEGNKVGSSEAALLAKLNVKPFQYGLNIKYMYEGGVFPTSVMKITDATLMGVWATAMGQVAALSLGAGFPTDASISMLVGAAVKNICAVALEADYIEFEKVIKIKDMLDNPDAYASSGPAVAVAATPAAGAAPAEAAKAPEPEPEPEEEEEDMGFDLFD